MTESSFDITEFKATEDVFGKPAGLFAAIVSVFGNVDRNGDRMMPGAFTKTIERWRTSGKPIPVVWTHEHNDPNAYIGEVDPADVKETAEGLVVAGKLDIDENPKARQIFNLLESGRLRQWSFAFQVKDERMGKDKAREIHEADLFELGPTLIGANPEALTLQVASANLEPKVTEALEAFDGEIDTLIETKIGRIVSAKTESKIRAAMATLEDILSSLSEEEAPAEQASSTPEAKAVEETPAEPPGETELLRRELQEVGLFLAGRD